MPTKSSSSSARCFSEAEPARRSTPRSQLSWRWVATSMFSSTVSRGNIRVSWKVRPMPSLNTRSGGALVMSVPRKLTAPCWMRS